MSGIEVVGLRAKPRGRTRQATAQTHKKIHNLKPHNDPHPRFSRTRIKSGLCLHLRSDLKEMAQLFLVLVALLLNGKRFPRAF